MSFLSGLFTFLTEAFGFWRQKDAQKNTPAMIAAKQAQREQQAADKTNEALRKNDLEELRKEASE